MYLRVMYIKKDAHDSLLLLEGVCRQLMNDRPNVKPREEAYQGAFERVDQTLLCQ